MTDDVTSDQMVIRLKIPETVIKKGSDKLMELN